MLDFKDFAGEKMLETVTNKLPAFINQITKLKNHDRYN